MDESMFDVIVVGAGPAGLSAALILGRSRRRVLICDSGSPRNSVTRLLHGFLTRDGIEPAEFLDTARVQLQQYETVQLRQVKVTAARRLDDQFEIVLDNDDRLSSRKLLLATGVIDDLPQIDGLSSFYGRSVFHCPYCDGWELRDQPLAVYGRGENGAGLALELLFWSRNLVLCTDGPSELEEKDIKRLAKHGVAIREEKIARLSGRNGELQQVIFEKGKPIDVRGMFFSTGQQQASNLPAMLGCEFNEHGCVDTGDYETTNVPGLYVAGDASKLVQFAVVAAAEGAQAAIAINKELMSEDLD